MKTIKCYNGELAMVDDEDYPLLSRHKWSYFGKEGKQYVSTTVSNTEGKYKNVYMHVMIMGCAKTIDHEDSNGLNNQKKNLRKATKSQNGGNGRKMKSRMGKPTSSRYKGVHWATAPGKWRAVVHCDGVAYQCGSFDCEHAAGEAYNKKAEKLFGKYALLNKISMDE
jgi:hypothetical protein